MIRRAVFLIVSILLFIALTFWFQISLNHDVERLISMVDEVEDLLSEPQKAISKFTELEEEWEQQSYIWAMAIPHQELIDVSTQITNLGVAIRMGDEDDAVLAGETIRRRMEHLTERNTLRLDHIL